MSDFYPLYIYFAVVTLVTLVILGLSGLFPSNRSSPVKFFPYESGIQTQTHLLEERFPLRHYLVALMFLVLDVQVIFLFSWALAAKAIGPFAFYEMAFFLLLTVVAFIYIWRKGGMQWE